ncbi:hypothetical protein, partial [Enterobacter intestinihominis]
GGAPRALYLQAEPSRKLNSTTIPNTQHSIQKKKKKNKKKKHKNIINIINKKIKNKKTKHQ